MDSATPTTEVAQPPRLTIRDYLRKLGPAGPLTVIATILPPISFIFLAIYMDSASTWLRSHAGVGPVIYAIAFMILGGLSLMPTQTYSALGGWAFGFAIGFPAAMVGYVLASLLGYAIARAVCGDRVLKILDEQPRWRAVYNELLCSKPSRALMLVTLVRLASSPFALTNIVFAAARVPLWIYLVGTAVGLSLRTGILVFVFANVGGEKFVYSEQKWMLWGGIATVVVVITVIAHMARKALDRVTANPPRPD